MIKENLSDFIVFEHTRLLWVRLVDQKKIPSMQRYTMKGNK